MKSFLAVTVSLFCMLIQVSTAWAVSVDWEVKKTLKIESSPIDVATSADGKLTFILAEKGVIFIYSAGGLLQDKISADKSIDGIEVSPGGDQLFLSSKRDKIVQIVSLDFVSNIETAGSPYKGPVNAPVVIAVFNDFQ